MDDDAFRELAETVARLQDREEIREVLHRYCRATDRADVELLKSCYHPDAVDFHGSAFSGNAHEFAEDVLSSKNLGALADVRHYITNTMIDLDGDQAFVESSFLCTLALDLPSGGAADAQSEGRYLDLFERRSGAWRIFRRVMFSQKLVWSRQPEQPGDVRAISADFSHRYPNDPVYLGFDIGDAIGADFRAEGDLWAWVSEHFERERLATGGSS
jgi:ketosteroid isomerase-like protein